MSAQIKIIQHNLNRDRVASHQLKELCRNQKIDFVLVQEPLIINDKVYAFETCKRAHISLKAGAAVLALTNRFQNILLSAYSSSHTVAVRVTFGPRPRDYVILVSAYFKYNIPTILHIERLNQILVKEKRTLIGADTNGHSKLWFSDTRNRRGRTIEEFIDRHGLMVQNVAGQMNTFCRRDNRTSNIDITITTGDIGHTVRNWEVSDQTDSDHRVISFNMRISKPPPRNPEPVRYNVKTADWALFNSTLLGEVGGIPEDGLDSVAEGINRALKTAAECSLNKKKPAGAPGKNPWWSSELTTLRKELVRSRRQGSIQPDYNRLKNQFLAAIRKHKQAVWKNFANELNRNPWAKAFSWAKNGSRVNSIPSTMMKEDGSHTFECRDTAELILDKFVPKDPSQGELIYQGPLEHSALPNPEDIKAAIWRIKPSGAPGMDGITANMLRKAWPALKDHITHLFGLCVVNGKFPESWKSAELILIPKPGKLDTSQVKSYRPISLLPVLGKALETIIIGRITNETALDLQEEQHGFTTGRSTSSALEEVYNWVDASRARHIFGTFLDITGAFDNVKWSPLLSQLIKLGASLGTVRIVQSYLTNRWASCHMEGALYKRMLERGCPQGSQLGPTLWKIAISPIYGTLINPSVSRIITYADDILLMVGAARPHTAFARIEN